MLLHFLSAHTIAVIDEADFVKLVLRVDVPIDIYQYFAGGLCSLDGFNAVHGELANKLCRRAVATKSLYELGQAVLGYVCLKEICHCSIHRLGQKAQQR